MTRRVLDLFSGVGSYSLGLERAGMRTVAFCEINAYCRRILRRHWPDVPIYEDVHHVTSDTLSKDGIAADVITAGWPCQDISIAGTGSGLDGARSGLWDQIARIAGEIEPRWLVLENSSNLLRINQGRDFGRMLADLAALGYDAEWHCLPAAAFDAPHIRDRLWIVANRRGAAEARADGVRERWGREQLPVASGEEQAGEGLSTPHSHGVAAFGASIARRERRDWEPEPDVGRVATGVAHRMDRIRALGNLNPPIIPELIGRAIVGHK